MEQELAENLDELSSDHDEILKESREVKQLFKSVLTLMGDPDLELIQEKNDD